MKKALLIIVAITLLFTACNADATSGLFRTISEAREAISIKYEQILGKDTSGNLYFRTEKGIYSLEKDKSAPNAKLIVASKENDIIQSAALVDDNILYTTNNKTKASTVFVYNPSTASIAELSPDSPYSLVRLAHNGQMLIEDKDTPNEYFLASYSSSPDKITNNLVATVSGLTNYGLEDIFIPSDYKDSTQSDKFIVSFAKTDGSSKNYYFNGTNFSEINSAIKGIANVSIIAADVYVLTTNGTLYLLDSTPSNSPTKLISTGLEFDRNDFFYPIVDSTTLHFITNPKNTDSMTVFTVDTSSSPISAGTSSTTSIKSGYAAALKDTKIVSSLDLGSNKFLVATEKHGMYSVTVNPAHVNEDSGNNIVTMSKAEDYTF